MSHDDLPDSTTRLDRDADDFQRPDGNSLEQNYELHDVAETHVRREIHDRGYVVENWGIDMRDGPVVTDERMDFKIHNVDGLVALVDVKSKSSASWMGEFNYRHYEHYLMHARSFDVPTFVVFCRLNSADDPSRVENEMLVPIADETVHRDGYFPDGNRRAVADEAVRYDWDVFEARVP